MYRHLPAHGDSGTTGSGTHGAEVIEQSVLAGWRHVPHPQQSLESWIEPSTGWSNQVQPVQPAGAAVVVVVLQSQVVLVVVLVVQSTCGGL
jgi:hypothetical protein